MSLLAISQVMLDAHAKHFERRPRCPLCAKYGPAPAPEGAYVGRPIPVNPPQSMNPAEW